MAVNQADREYFAELVHRLLRIGSAPIALYGAGRAVDALRPTLIAPEGSIVGIIDDDAAKHGKRWARLPVISLDEAKRLGVRGIIITAEGAAQDALFAKRRPLLDMGAQVLCVPRRFANQEWDGALSDWYEHHLAKSRGMDLIWVHEYPSENARVSSSVVEAALERLPERGAVCEIGPGAGLWTEKLLARAGRYFAVDYSARLLHEVIEHRFAKNLDRLSVHHDAKASLAGVPDGSVDLVFSFDVFVHFKIDLVHQFLTAIRRVLKPGGKAMIHFARWNADAIEVWRTQHTRHHHGGVSLIHCNHMDWLAESARSCELRIAPVGEPFAWGFLAEFSRPA